MTEHAKFYFSDRVTLDRLTKLDEFFRDLKDSNGLEGCIIGGVAVAANYINRVFGKYNIKDKEYSNKIKVFSRPTSDIDIVIDGEKPNNFYDLILKYFGTANLRVKDYDIETLVETTPDMPFMSFHFIPSADSAVPDSQSIFYKPFIEGSKTLSFKTSNTERYKNGSGEKEIPTINCRVANSLDLVVMKLKSCSERTTIEKTNSDLMDIIKMLGITGYTVSDAIGRAKEISFDGIRYIDRYGSKIKKSVNLLTNYLRQISSNELDASRKIDLLVPSSEDLNSFLAEQ